MRTINKTMLTAMAAGFVFLSMPSAHAQRTIVVQNNCNQTIWPGIYEEGIDGASAPNPQPMNGGWALSTGQSTTLTLPTGFSGRIWARKDCTFNASGQGSCETGDCGGVLQCNGATGQAGTSLAEFTLYQPNDLTAYPQDWYDVSYVDGYDFPISITPSNSTYEAPTVSYDMLSTCPAGQQVKNAAGVVVQCLSACTRYGTDPTVPTVDQEIYCCAPPYNSAALCNPSNYPNPPGNLNAPFKAAAPNSYSWSDDDPTSVWHYAGNSGVTYTVTFCPTSGYGTVVQTSGNGEYDGPTSTGGSWNSCSTTPSAPPTPAGLAATAGNASVLLSWGASTGATSYNVYRSTTSGGEGATAYASAVVGTSYTDTAVANGVTYYYTVAAVNGGGTSAQSGQVSATPSSGSGSTGGGGSTTTETMIDCGGAASGGWSADAGFSGGMAISVTNTINLSDAPSPAPTQAVMQTERDGNVTYTITGLTANSKHTVDLYFSENNFSSTGQREFDVAIQGATVLTNFDVYANAGAEYKAVEQSFSSTASSSGQIVITLTTVKYNAEINAIAIE